MLTEQRYEEIIKLLEVYGTITVQELRDKLDASESTIRRDLNFLHSFKSPFLIAAAGPHVMTSRYSKPEG